MQCNDERPEFSRGGGMDSTSRLSTGMLLWEMHQFHTCEEAFQYPRASSYIPKSLQALPHIDNGMPCRSNVRIEEFTPSSNHKRMWYFHRIGVFCTKFGLQRLLQWP